MRRWDIKGRGSFVRATSALVALVFLCSNVLFFDAQLLAQDPGSSNVREGIDIPLLAPASVFSGNMQDLIVPPELGFIHELSREGQPSSSQFVILVQDAHAVPEAQRSLEQMIEYFQARYGIRAVALEGAQGKLDATLFRFFPDPQKREKVFAEYLERGELSGAAAASALSPNRAEYVGIEDWTLYQEGVAAFLDGLKNQAGLNAQRATLHKELQKLKAQYYSRDALEFNERFSAWDENREDLPGFLNYLIRRNEERADVPARYPAVRTVLQSLQGEHVAEDARGSTGSKLAVASFDRRSPQYRASPQKQASRGASLDQEIKAFFTGAGLRFRTKTRFNQLKQSFQTGRMGRSEMAYELSSFFRAAAYPFSPSREFQQAVARHERVMHLKGPQFMKELEQLIRETKATVFVSPEEKTLADLEARLRLLGKLGRFELNRKEWSEISVMRKAQHAGPSVKTKEFLTLGNNIFVTLNSPEAAIFFNFYEITIKRESAFLSNIQNLLRLSVSRSALPVARATKAVVFVAGGFHTDGLALKLKEKGVPYLIVSPAMKEVPGGNRYFDQMQGKVSWREYFRPVNGKVDLYDAFVRATVERLMSRGTGNGERKPDMHRAALKEWRDEVIRKLAAEGRVSEHSKYTRFLDRHAAENSEAFQSLKEKWTVKLEKFIEGLRFLQAKNQLTEAEMIRLLSRPANQTPVAVASLVPGNNIPRSFIEFRGARSEMRGGAAVAFKDDAFEELPESNGRGEKAFLSYWLDGKWLTERKAILDAAFGTGAAAWLGGVIAFNGNREVRRTAALWLSRNQEFLTALNDPSKDLWIEAIRIMVKARMSFGTKAMQLFSRDLKPLLPGKFQTDVLPSHLPFAAYFDLIAALGHGTIQGYFSSPAFLTLPRGERLKSVMKKIRALGLPVTTHDRREILRAMPKDLRERSQAGMTMVKTAPAGIPEARSQTSLAYRVKGERFVKKEKILDVVFGRNADAWFAQTTRFAGSRKKIQDTVDWLLGTEEFKDLWPMLERDPHRDPWIETIRIMVKYGRDPGTKTLFSFSPLFKEALKKKFASKRVSSLFPTIHLSFEAYGNEIAALGHASMQEFLSSPEFEALDESERTLALFEKFREKIPWLTADNLGDFCRALPKEIRGRVIQIELSFERLAQIRKAEKDENVRSFIFGPMMEGKDKKERITLLIDALRRRGFLQGPVNPHAFYHVLSRPVRQLIDIENSPREVSSGNGGRQQVSGKAMPDYEIFQDVLSRIHGMKSYAAIEEQLLRLRARGEKVFTAAGHRRSMSRRPDVSRRLIFLWEILGYKDRAGESLVTVRQAVSIERFYGPAKANVLRENVRWLLDQEKDDGKPLFSTANIRFWLMQGKRLKREAFEKLWALFSETELPPGELLNYLAFTSELREAFHEWQFWPSASWLNGAQRLRLFMLRRTKVDVEHVLGLTGILFHENANDFQDYIKRSVAEDRVLLEGVKNNGPLSDEVIKRLVLSFSAEVRRQTMDLVYDAMTNIAAKEGRRDSWDGLELSSEHLLGYKWTRPTAGLKNLARNIRIVESYRRSFGSSLGFGDARRLYSPLGTAQSDPLEKLLGMEEDAWIEAEQRYLSDPLSRSEMRTAAAVALKETVSGKVPEAVGLPYWLYGKRMTDKREILETVFGKGAVEWFEGVSTSGWDEKKTRRVARWLVRSNDFQGILKDPLKDPWIATIQLLIKNGQRNPGTRSLLGFSEKVRELLPAQHRKRFAKIHSSFSDYAAEIAALGHAAVQDFLLSGKFNELDRTQRTVALAEKILSLGLPLGSESLESFYRALPKDIRQRVSIVRGMAIVSGAVTLASSVENPVSSYWLKGLRSTDRKEILETVFGGGAEEWFERASVSEWDPKKTEAVARWLASNAEFVGVLKDPAMDPWIGAIQILVKNSREDLGTRSLNVLSEKVRGFLPFDYRKTAMISRSSFSGYADEIAALGHMAVQDFLLSEKFEKLDKPQRTMALAEKILDLGLPLASDLYTFYTALPKDIRRCVSKVEPSMIASGAVKFESPAENPVSSYWLKGLRSTDRKEILETVFGGGAADWFEKVSVSKWDPSKVEMNARLVIKDPEFLKVLKDPSLDPWITAIQILIKNRYEDLGTRSMMAFSEKVRELLPAVYRKHVAKCRYSFSGYADEIAALGHVAVQDYLLSEKFEKLDKPQRTVALAEKILSMGLPLGPEDLDAFYTALPKDIRRRVFRVRGMIIDSGSVKFVPHDGNPVTSYWIDGKFLTDRKAILEEAFGAGAAGWLNNVVSYSGDQETRREAAFWLSKNREFLEALNDPSKDPWIEAVRMMVKARRSFGTKSMQLFSREIRHRLPEKFRINITDNNISFTAYFDLIAAAGHGAIQKYLASRGFLRLPQPKRAEALAKKMRDLGLPLRANTSEGVLMQALPRDILDRVRSVMPASKKLGAVERPGTEEKGSLAHRIKNKGLTDQAEILESIFGPGAEPWFVEAVRSAGSAGAIQDTVKWLVENEEFEALLNDLTKDPLLDPWIETLRIMVKYRKNPGTKTMMFFSKQLKEALAAGRQTRNTQKMFPVIKLSFLAYAHEIAALGHAATQDFLSSHEFEAMDELERTGALFEKLRQNGLWVETNHLGHFFGALPNEIRERVAQINLPLEKFDGIQTAMKDERVRSFIQGPMMAGRDRMARLTLLIDKVLRLGFLSEAPGSLQIFYSALPREVRQRINIEKIPAEAAAQMTGAEEDSVPKGTTVLEKEIFIDVLSRIRGVKNYASIAEQLSLLKARGKKIFSDGELLGTMSRRPDVYDRIVFLGEVLEYKDRRGQNLFGVGQSARLANFPASMNAGMVKENIVWMLDQETEDGRPLFSTPEIRFCIANGKLFKKNIFEALWARFERTELPVRTLLGYMAGTNKVLKAFQDWQAWPLERWMNSSRQLRFLMLNRTQVDVEHVLGLVEVLFPEKAEDLHDYVRRSVAEDRVLLDRVKAGGSLSDGVIKRLVVSFSLAIRREALVLIYAALEDIYAKAGRLEIWDGMEFSHAYIKAYEWMRPDAGLANLARNIQIIERKQRLSPDQSFGPDRDRNLHQVLAARQSDPLERLLREEEEAELALAETEQEPVFNGFFSPEKTRKQERPRSELRQQQVYKGILDRLLRQKPATAEVIREFLERVRTDLGGTVAGLRWALKDVSLPEAVAEIVSRETRTEDMIYRTFEETLSGRTWSRETLDRAAGDFYRQSLDKLAEAIGKREAVGMAPVVFYAPEMKEKLIPFIETVQKSFEATGDVTGQNYRITLVSRDKKALLKLKTELSKRGALRGVYFETDVRPLERDVFQSARFKESFGVFFPDEEMAASISSWERRVSSQVPKEWGILLLPALSRYFAVMKTSDINAMTLQQALPGLSDSVQFKIGQGIQIVLALLERILTAEKQFAASA